MSEIISGHQKFVIFKAQLRDMWRPGEPRFIEMLKKTSNFPRYWIEIIQMIKQIGTTALGPIRSFVEPKYREQDHMTANHVLAEYSSLQCAVDDGIIDFRDIDQCESLHISGDNDGLMDILHLLPRFTISQADREEISAPFEIRMPIQDMQFTGIKINPDEEYRQFWNCGKLAYLTARYLQLIEDGRRDSIHTMDDLFQLANACNKRLILVDYGFALWNYFITSLPGFERKDLQNVGGKVGIAAGLFFDAGDSGYKPRFILSYALNRKLSNRALQLAQARKEEIRQSARRYYDATSRALQFPMSAGQFEGGKSN